MTRVEMILFFPLAICLGLIPSLPTRGSTIATQWAHYPPQLSRDPAHFINSKLWPGKGPFSHENLPHLLSPCGLGPLKTGEFGAAREATTVFPAAHCGPASGGALWDLPRPGGQWSRPGPQRTDPGEVSSMVGPLWPAAKLWPEL